MATRNLILGLLGTASLIALAVAVTAQAADDTPEDAGIVVEGKVIDIKATTSKHFVNRDKSIVVELERVRSCPGELAGNLKRGTKVTIQVEDPSRFRKGERAVFHTELLSLSDSVCLAAQSAEKLPADTVSQDVPPVDSALVSRLRKAELVVVGTVTHVSPADSDSPLREQGPDWREVDLRVDRVLKGERPAKNQIQVRTHWPTFRPDADFPRLEPKQQRIFLLHRDPELDPQRLLIQDPADVQKTARLAEIEKLLSRKR
jgi:hypothetical protein